MFEDPCPHLSPGVCHARITERSVSISRLVYLLCSADMFFPRCTSALVRSVRARRARRAPPRQSLGWRRRRDGHGLRWEVHSIRPSPELAALRMAHKVFIDKDHIRRNNFLSTYCSKYTVSFGAGFKVHCQRRKYVDKFVKEARC